MPAGSKKHGPKSKDIQAPLASDECGAGVGRNVFWAKVL